MAGGMHVSEIGSGWGSCLLVVCDEALECGLPPTAPPTMDPTAAGLWWEEVPTAAAQEGAAAS